MKTVIIDMQPITPAVGGGRQRLLGLYHALGADIEAVYIGTYDWHGEPHRDQMLTPGLRERLVPLSEAHHEAARHLATKLDGRIAIDLAFADQAKLSPQYLDEARRHIADAQVVVFSHPWAYPPLRDAIRPGQLVVYDSHNVEAVLRTSLFGDLPAADCLLRRAAELEYMLCREADLVLACSQEDAAIFTRIFDTPPTKLRVVPNGAFTERLAGAEDVDRFASRESLGLPVDQPVAIFLGSMYGPNVEAARFIALQLASACPDVFFVIAGGVGQALTDVPASRNLLVTGQVDDTIRDKMLLAADVALNPMDAGSGTNIKMFDYMAAGLPVLSTETGARGIGSLVTSPEGVVVASKSAFQSKLAELIDTLKRAPGLRRSVRDTVCARFSWERISTELGQLLQRAQARLQNHQKSGCVAIFTTWNISCGIGEHSARFVDAFEAAGFDTLVIGNDVDGHAPLGFERDLHHAVVRAWHWDNLRWRDSRIDLDQLRRTLLLAKPQFLLIQHHSAFVPDYDVAEALRLAREIGLPVLIEMHDGRKLSASRKEAWIDLGAILVAHHADELEGVRERGRSHVLQHPLIVSAAPDAVRTAHNRAQVIAGFGFLRPHKGLLTTIRVIARLRERYPGLCYRGWHAKYPGAESDQHLQDCLREAEVLGVAAAVEIDTTFHPIDHLMSSLADSDLVLMPYQPSDEGASGAVNTALSAGRPVVVSPSAIFRPVASVVAVSDGYEVANYVEAVSALLDDSHRATDLAAKARQWVKNNSYPSAVQRLATFAGLALAPSKEDDHD